MEDLKKPLRKKGSSTAEIENEENELIHLLSLKDKNNIITKNLIDLVGFHRRELPLHLFLCYEIQLD